MAALPDRFGAGPVELVRWAPTLVEPAIVAIQESFVALHRWMPWAATVPTPDELESVFRHGSDAFDRDEEWQYLLVEPISDAVVGGVGLHRRGTGRFEIGYWVRTDRTGRGYATAAARVLTDAAFSHLADAKVVEIHMDRANGPSAAVPPKIGYRLLAEEVRDIVTPGHTGQGLVWVLEREAWVPADRR